jgi:heptosyltransferase-1
MSQRTPFPAAPASAPMADILFIKTSSLGDVIHHMPAVSDVRRHLPDARLSWVVEEVYAPLARLHKAVDEVIPVASRRWRARLFDPAMWREIGAFRRTLRERSYAAAIDSQGLLRTAMIARSACGVRHGYDMASIREPAACVFYDVRHRVARGAHAILRNRALCGLALGYRPGPAVEFGLDARRLVAPAAAKTTDYAVLIHGTAKPAKEWPQADWLALARGMAARGLDVVLPWGADAERRRSETLAAALGGRVLVPDRRPLDEVAALIAGASLVVGVDTGLVHLAAALAVPLVAIFLGSEPGLTGPLGAGPIEVVGGKGATPQAADVLHAIDRIAAHGS